MRQKTPNKAAIWFWNDLKNKAFPELGFFVVVQSSRLKNFKTSAFAEVLAYMALPEVKA